MQLGKFRLGFHRHGNCKHGQTDSRHHRGLSRRMKRLSKNK